MFSDADMAGVVDGRRSTSGVLVFLGSSPVAWQSVKQKMWRYRHVRLSTSQRPQQRAKWSSCDGC